MATARDRVQFALQVLGIAERDARRRTFAAGPGTGPMDNALTAVRYSVPLIILFSVWSLDLALESNVVSFPILESLTPLVRSVGYWALLAFVFGYFYQALRRIDGPAKGWAFAFALAVPPLAVIVLNQQPILGLTTGDRILRIALFVSALALTFDARIVLREGFPLRNLVLVYGVAPSFAFASSLAALGGISLGPLIKVAGRWVLQTLGFQVCPS